MTGLDIEELERKVTASDSFKVEEEVLRLCLIMYEKT